MKNTIYIFLILAIAFGSCEPISLKDNEENPERDVVGDVLSLVSPDTVQISTPFTIQMTYPKMCGGTFKAILANADTNYNVFVQPVIHIVPQSNCPAVIEYATASTSITIPHLGAFTLIGVGNYGVVRKNIVVTNSLSTNGTYRISYKFQNRTGDALSSRSSNLRYTSVSPVQQFSFTTDSNGVWDTTFTASPTTLTYMIGDFQFQAKQGVTENGIIVIP